ncbi:hypothetical protein D3C86_1700900 [compost metagenome]
MADKMREEFENHPKFKGMDFRRSATHPDYYESPYANGALDGWKASRQTITSVVKVKSICPNKNEKGACPLHNLHCAYPKCEEQPKC